MDPVTLLLYAVAVLLVLVGFAGVVLPALPGVPLILMGLWLAAWLGDYAQVGPWTLGLLALLTLVAVLVDFLAGLLGAKRVGAHPKAIWGAFLGSVIGIFFGLPGLILGPFIGAVAGELMARPDIFRATEVGVATWIGLLLGTLAKLAISVTMLAIFVVALIF